MPDGGDGTGVNAAGWTVLATGDLFRGDRVVGMAPMNGQKGWAADVADDGTVVGHIVSYNQQDDLNSALSWKCGD